MRSLSSRAPTMSDAGLYSRLYSRYFRLEMLWYSCAEDEPASAKVEIKSLNLTRALPLFAVFRVRFKTRCSRCFPNF